MRPSSKERLRLVIFLILPSKIKILHAILPSARTAAYLHGQALSKLGIVFWRSWQPQHEYHRRHDCSLSLRGKVVIKAKSRSRRHDADEACHGLDASMDTLAIGCPLPAFCLCADGFRAKSATRLCKAKNRSGWGQGHNAKNRKVQVAL